ncbi:MAG TPA: NTF2-like N-terminal transpeptidase domain-containing protein, partial [Anaerolineales bacterium]|nr:NTF2-like N-terminal transpeptidase domain-containing protein [Anaerolineales bacterium]
MKLIAPLLVLSFLLAACSGGGGSAELPTPQVSVNSAPDAEGTANAYLSAWNEGAYAAMYEMLTAASQQAISLEDFQARYAMVATQTNLFRVDYEILSSLTNPKDAQIGYRVTLNSAVIGAITRETGMTLGLEGGLWRVVWEDHIMLPELAGGNRLSLERFVPTRGIIYGREGLPIAANTTAVAVGVYPSLIVDGDENDVLSELARVSQRPVDEISQLVFPEEGDADYYVPIAEVSQEEFE